MQNNTPEQPRSLQKLFDRFRVTEMMVSGTREFFKLEAAGGIMLVIASIIALILANTQLYEFYNWLLNEITFTIGFNDIEHDLDFYIGKPLLLWINDGLMAIFFFLVGLEIKREIVEGDLSSRERALLPALAAVGGIVVPAAIYYFINMDIPENVGGWAIPAATDIAFALGVLALLGSRAPLSLKILLTAIAVIDDLGAILIIALFYTAQLKILPLIFAAFCFLGLLLLNKLNVSKITPYSILGVIMWVAVLKSGVHATLAGVITALCIPMRCWKEPSYSPVKHLEHSLHPWVAFMILPIFAFANAGVSFEGMTFESLLDPVTLGIAAGLFLGKQVGIFSLLFLAVKMKISPMPVRTNWMQLYGVSLLCGIGFTMSLFIGGLAFDTQDNAAAVRLGVMTASVLSAVTGYLVIRFAPQVQPEKVKKQRLKREKFKKEEKKHEPV